MWNVTCHYLDFFIYLILVFFSDQNKCIVLHAFASSVQSYFMMIAISILKGLNLMFNTAKIGCNCVLLYLVIIIMI